MCGSLIEIGSKMAEKNSAQTNKQTDCKTDTTKIMVTWPWTKRQYVLHMSPQYGELRPASSWDRSGSLMHPCKFQRVLRLGSVTAWHLVVGVSQTLRRWTENATCVRQGDHHVGHWPTFLVTTGLNVSSQLKYLMRCHEKMIIDTTPVNLTRLFWRS